jgi:uncharacterized protein (TIGR03435 family)
MMAHRVSQEAEGYGIVISKGGPKIKASKDDSQLSNIAATGGGRGVIQVKGQNVSIADLAQTLHRIVGTPFWDRTGLLGTYSFVFRFMRDLSTDIETDAPSLTTALRDSLGLQLEKQKGPVDALIIDSVEEPSVN